MLILLTGIVAFGWTFGVALVALAGLANVVPQGWAMRDLLIERGRRSALMYGLALMLASKILYVATELMLSTGYY